MIITIASRVHEPFGTRRRDLGSCRPVLRLHVVAQEDLNCLDAVLPGHRSTASIHDARNICLFSGTRELRPLTLGVAMARSQMGDVSSAVRDDAIGDLGACREQRMPARSAKTCAACGSLRPPISTVCRLLVRLLGATFGAGADGFGDVSLDGRCGFADLLGDLLWRNTAPVLTLVEDRTNSIDRFGVLSYAIRLRCEPALPQSWCETLRRQITN